MVRVTDKAGFVWGMWVVQQGARFKGFQVCRVSVGRFPEAFFVSGMQRHEHLDNGSSVYFV